jgi:oligopeptide/dipeptide ABC transporter ATP-binding protein
MAKKLEVNNLIISFRTNNGTVKAVRDISFDLEKGETLAIVGESGSGKSVTARAIMGILAKNAIPEGGEIIYDGQDLMKIDEEDFHKIRGNRISMIFQDPLSSLNPIVRIGKQLTEAMILNGKANQREAKRVYTAKTKLLRAEMKEAGVADVDAKFSIFDKVTAEGSKLESGYNYSRERAESMMKNIEAVLIDSIDQEPKKVAKEMKLIKADEKNLYNPYLIDKGKSELPSLMEAFSNAIPEYVATGKHEKTDGLLRKMQGLLKKVLETTMPDFYAMAYCRMNNAMPAYHDDNAALNSEMQAIFNERFLDSFHKDVAAGIENSNRKSFDKKGSIVESLNTALEKMSGEGRIDLKVAKEETRKCATEIENALDKLAINKDSIAYTFKSSITAAVNTYGESLRVEKLKHPGKKDRMFKDRMDIDLYQNNIRLILTHARDSFQNQLDSAEKLNAEDLSNEMVKFLCNESSKRVFKVTKRKAQIRAIELMEEVGIANARQRYRQYPFEFSGGMRQRIVIAIALAANPDILICDEPTTALDVTIQAQILELINKLKAERQLSIIFITHDLGVVANMADKIAVMYAGKIVEYGTADDVFYDPRHPYTWALLSSMPDLDTKEKLDAIPGTPPNMIFPPKGDAFAERNKYAMQIDFEEQPPMFKVSDTHYAATWLMHPSAPKVEPPKIVTDRIARMKKLNEESRGDSNE